MSSPVQGLRYGLESVRSAFTSRWPVLSRTYWHHRHTHVCPLDREAHFLLQSPDCQRLRLDMAKRRQGDLQYWGGHEDMRSDTIPHVTICLVTHNSILDLPTFEQAILALDYPSDRISFQIVENGSHDGTRDWLEDFVKNRSQSFAAVQTHYGENVGFGAAQNIAIDAARTDLILVCNPDARLAPDSLKIAVEQTLRDPENIAAWEFAQRPFEHPKYYDPVSLETSWNSHACVLLRRRAVLEVGSYDPALFLYGEDVDLSYRLRQAGFRLRYLPKAKVSHDALVQSGRRDEQAFRALAANALLRQRFGSLTDRLIGRLLIRQGKEENSDDVTQAQALFEKSRKKFRPQKRFNRSTRVPSPFSGVHYDRRRQGAAHPMPGSETDISSLGKVSIITRSHAPGPVLDQAIATVRHQTYPDIEHIVVQDGYGETYETASTRYISTQGLGRSAAGNIGAKAASGEWMLWLDYDDLLFADHVETLLSALHAQRETDETVIGAYSLAWESAGKSDGSTILPLSLHTNASPHEDVTIETLQHENPFAIQSVLFHRSLFDRFGGFDESLDLLEDWDLWQRYAEAGRFIPVPKTTSIFHTPGKIWPRIKRQYRFRAAYATLGRTG